MHRSARHGRIHVSSAVERKQLLSRARKVRRSTATHCANSKRARQPRCKAQCKRTSSQDGNPSSTQSPDRYSAADSSTAWPQKALSNSPTRFALALAADVPQQGTVGCATARECPSAGETAVLVVV